DYYCYSTDTSGNGLF
nr:immunoglobulin light chain junction region [Macaca mulatta]MOX16700.1 immunoglobulin light chain junction region [Macaca mulatta]MOX16840.1 immunoglobulin light chain junction region [Macaca mulatta]MOX16851.1 immunoglobulin light chain junction region [Macaca mulatta]MOX16880.1 immunoglobulin light chain junction region [Macaca mulatta]